VTWRGVHLVPGLTVALALALPASRDAHADPPPADVEPSSAAALYDAGLAAHLRGDLVLAAESFARADELEPNEITLETALREALRADLPVLGMRLHARLRRVPSPNRDLRATARAVATAFGERVAWVALACEGCTAEVDGEELAAGAELPLLPGTHVVVVRSGAPEPARTLELAAGERVTLRPGLGPTRETQPPPAPYEPPSGVHPAWLTLGVVATLGFTAGAIGSYAQASDLESELEAKRRAREPEGADRLAEEGQSAETRLYAFTALATLSALGTTALAVWAIDWTGGSATVSVGPRGLRLAGAW
jgi:hypothetical protein